MIMMKAENKMAKWPAALRTVNSAIVDKPLDAFAQYAMAWLTR